MATKTRRKPFGGIEPMSAADIRREHRERAAETDELRQAYEAGRADAKDEQPGTSGPRGRPTPPRVARSASRAGKGLDRRVRRFLSLGTANPRRVLMLELMGVLVVVTVDQLAHGDMPSPRPYVASFVVYLVLSFAAEVGGPGGARVATGFGALVLVAIVLANAPGIVRALQVASGQRAPRMEGVG